MEAAVEINGLTKRYGSLTAVNRLNLRVEPNTIHGFLGPNGAGKTTTIKILVGLLRADEGRVKILGKELRGDMPEIRNHMGYMPELPKFPRHLKGAELLDIYGRMFGMTEQERKDQIPKLIELVGLKGRENDFIGKYSKGMQQRIGIAQALLNSPELVILDEPSLGLDPVGMVEARELVKTIAKEGKTVLISSHLLFEVEQVCTHVTIINKGEALVSDTLEKTSHLLAGKAILQIEVIDLSDKIVKALKEFSFVSSMTQSGDKLTIELKTNEDVRVQVSKAITRLGGTIVAMSQKSSNLEDVFIQLVGKHQGGPPQ
jgi:ABC-2 type transport system ATP-binding protein